MKTLIKQVGKSFLILAVALAVMIGSTERSSAAYYNYYYSDYLYYLSVYHATGALIYYDAAIAFYYYYLAGFEGDYTGYFDDAYGFKSTNYRGGIVTRSTTTIIMLTTVTFASRF